MSAIPAPAPHGPGLFCACAGVLPGGLRRAGATTKAWCIGLSGAVARRPATSKSPRETSPCRAETFWLYEGVVHRFVLC